MKKLLSLIVSLVLVFATLSISGILTVQAETYSGTCGDNLTWILDTNTCALTIVGSGDMYDYGYFTDTETGNTYNYNDSPWYYYRYYIKSVNLPDGLTYIGNDAFYNCYNLVSVVIPNTVTLIRSGAFSNTGLTEINIPESVRYIGHAGSLGSGRGVFQNCTNLKRVTLPESLFSIGMDSFNGCSSITNIILPKNINMICASAFYECSSLKNVYYCGTEDEWNSIYIDYNNEYLTNAQRYYHNFGDWSIDANGSKSQICSICGEKKVLTEDANHNFVNGVCDICNVISKESLTYTISNNTVTITACDTSTSGAVVIPDALDGYPVTSIGDSAFSGNDMLTSITIPGSVTSIGNGAFSGCSSLDYITIHNGVLNIGAFAFGGCSSLTSILLPDSLKSIGNGAFNICSSLTSITLPNSITSMGNEVFYNCSSLTSIEIPNSVTSIGHNVFYNCNSLTSITIPDSITSISDSTFRGCSSLTSITLPNSLMSMGNEVFYNCSSLTSIEIPNSVTSIRYATFYNCSSLTSITIPNSIASIEGDAFFGCRLLETVYYCGTEEQWNKISISSWNSNLKNAKRYYHTFSEWIISTDATCETVGEEYRTCSNCNTEETRPISATGHSFSDWTIKTNADCETDGEKYRICSTCKYEETMTIPAHGHSFSEVFDIYKEPTDFEEGLKFRICTNLCGAVTDETVIPKTSLVDGICGENAKWAVRADGTLIIAGNGATDNYKLPTYAPWNNYSSTITQIIISNGITYIGNNNFGNFTALDKVVIENPHCSFGLWVFPDDTSKFSIYSMGGSNVEEYANSNGITLVKPENPITPIAPVLKFRTESSVELTKIDGYEYSMDGVNWQIEPLFENLISGTNYTFYQRIAGGVYAPSEKSEPLYISTLAKPDSPIIESVDKNKVTLQYKEGFEYSINGIDWQNSNVFNKIPFDTLICFYQRKTATETDGTTSASELTKCIIASTPMVLVGESSIKVTPKENYEYCIDDMVWQDSNIFTKYIIPNETYTVYQRPKAQENVEIFYDTEGITVCVNGTDSLTVPNATHLVWLKKILLSNDGYCSISADFNNDSTVDIRDLVCLKKTLATTISTKIEYNIPYVSYAESQYSDLRVTKFTFTTDGMCSVDDFHYTKLSEQTEDSLVYNGEYYGNAEGGGNSGIFTINEDIITVTSAEEYNYGDLLWKFTVNSDRSLTLTEIGNDFEDMFITGTVYITE